MDKSGYLRVLSDVRSGEMTKRVNVFDQTVRKIRCKKSDAKRRKAERQRNKKLIARYPWIRPVDLHWRSIKGYDFTMYDCVPVGWKRAFGKIMLEDYREVLIKNGFLNRFQWLQVKEKYGTLRLYSNGRVI